MLTELGTSISNANFWTFRNIYEGLYVSTLFRNPTEDNSDILSSLLQLHIPIVLYLISVFQMQSISINKWVGLETYFSIGSMGKYIPSSKWVYPLINLALTTYWPLTMPKGTVRDTKGCVITPTSVYKWGGESSNECQVGRKYSKCCEVQFGKVP